MLFYGFTAYGLIKGHPHGGPDRGFPFSKAGIADLWPLGKKAMLFGLCQGLSILSLNAGFNDHGIGGGQAKFCFITQLTG